MSGNEADLDQVIAMLSSVLSSQSDMRGQLSEMRGQLRTNEHKLNDLAAQMASLRQAVTEYQCIRAWPRNTDQ